jgi:hypothetical protein
LGSCEVPTSLPETLDTGAVDHRQKGSCGTGDDLANLDLTTPLIAYLETSENHHTSHLVQCHFAYMSQRPGTIRDVSDVCPNSRTSAILQT